MTADCPACEGKGLVRLRWNRFHFPHTIHYYRDEWCRRCGGKGVIERDGPAPKKER